MKGEVKEIINCRIDCGKRYFEVIWKSSWEEEEVVRDIADDLVEEFLKCYSDIHQHRSGEDVRYDGLLQPTNDDVALPDDSEEDRLQINEDIIDRDEVENDVSNSTEVAAIVAESRKPKKSRKGGINSIISRLQKNQQEGLLKTFDDELTERENNHEDEDHDELHHAPHPHHQPNGTTSIHPRTPTGEESCRSNSIVLERPHAWKHFNSENNIHERQRSMTPTYQGNDAQRRADMSNSEDYEPCSPVGPREAPPNAQEGSLPNRSAASPINEGSSSTSLLSLKTNVDNISKLFSENNDGSHEVRSHEPPSPKHARMEGASPSQQPMKMHHPGSMLKCQICSDLFYEESKFKQHMFMHEQVSLLRQETPKLLKPGTFECKFCNILFDDKDKLKTHYSDEHEEEFVHTQPMDQLYQCSLCDQTFVDYNKLIQHHQTHQQGRREVFILPKKPPKGVTYPPVDPRENQGSSGPTLVHHRASPQKQEPIRHPNGPATHENRRPVDNSSPENLEKFDDVFEEETETIEPVTDEMLLKTTGKEENEDHVMTAEYGDKKLFRCNLCDELFENENDRARHSLIHVNRSSSLDCHICGKQFRHRTNLSTHLIVHSGVKPHQCHICLRRFTQKVNLQRHMHIHDGSRPFTCRMCSKSFTQKANLQRHILSHTEHTKEELLLALNEIPNESEVNNAINESLTEAMSIVMEQKQQPVGDIGEQNTEYRCDVCDKTFAQKVNLQKHMMIHNGTRPFQCYICGKSFRQRTSLQKHYAVHTNGSSSFICQTCNRLFVSRTNLQRHMLVHALPGQNQCYLCDQKFTTTDNLERHFSEHIEEATPTIPIPPKYLEQQTPGQTFRCATCEIVFDSPIVFSQHLQCHQNVFPPDTTPNDLVEMGRVHNPMLQLQLKCHTCGAMCMGYEALEDHMLVHHSIPEQPIRMENKYPNDNMRNVQVSSSSHVEHQAHTWTPPVVQVSTSPRMVTPPSNHSETMVVKQEVITPPRASNAPHTPRVSRCPVCKEMFPSKKEMREHYSIAHLEAPNTETSAQSVETAAEANNYTETIHPEEDGIPIVEPVPEEDISVSDESRMDPDNPDETFQVAVISESEERLIKENEEFIKDNILGGPAEYESKGRYERGNYSCKICNRVLTYKYSLEKHMLLHTGSFPYKCHLCSKRFNHKANYDKHLVVHRGEKPYSCHICARPFSQKSNLQRHQLTHTQNRDFICDVCGKRFNHMASLKTHSLIHTGAKPFSCYICTKRFNQKGNLKRHIQTHRTGKRNKISGLENDPDIDSIIKTEMDSMMTSEEMEETMVKTEDNEDNRSRDPYSYIPKESATMVTMQDDSFYARAAKVHHELTQMEATEALFTDHPIKMEKDDTAPARRSQRPRHKKNMDDYEFLDYDEPLPTMIGGEEFKKSTNSQQPGEQPQPGRSQEKEVMPYPMGYEGEQILTVLPSDAMYGDEVDRKPFPEVKYEKEERKETFHCGQCSKLFISLASLEAHKKHAHSFIMCDICGRPFSQKANLLKHKLIHANKKPFACRVCNKAFRQKANLQRHELIHDKDRKTVNCSECNKSFRCAWSLKQHMKNHNSAGGAFGCSICGKTFKGKDRLMQHFTVHNQLGVFTCHICGIKFPNPEHLLKHLETHGSFPVPNEEGAPVDVMTAEGQLTWVAPSMSGENTIVVSNPPDEHELMTEYSNGNSPVEIPNNEMMNGAELTVKTFNGKEAVVHTFNPHGGFPMPSEEGDLITVQHGEATLVTPSMSGMSGMSGHNLVVVTNVSS